MFEFVGVGWVQDGVMRLERCSLAVQPGEVFGLVGGSGAGKTAVLEVAAGLHLADKGRILLSGRDVSRKPERLRAVAALCGGPLPGPQTLSVEAWIALWAELDGVPKDERKARIARSMTELGLAGLEARPVRSLSTGQKARLALARSWNRRPQLYLLDAPASVLDGEGLRRLTAMVRAVVAGGATVVIASAAPHFPSSVCDRVALVAKGAVSGEFSRRETGFQEAIATAQGWTA